MELNVLLTQLLGDVKNRDNKANSDRLRYLKAKVLAYFELS